MLGGAWHLEVQPHGILFQDEIGEVVCKYKNTIPNVIRNSVGGRSFFLFFILKKKRLGACGFMIE